MRHSWSCIGTAALLFLALPACSDPPTEAPVDDGLFAALVEERAPDGREGLDVYAPEDRDVVLNRLEEEARAWSRGPDATAELDGLLSSHDPSTDAGRSALFVALRAFVARNAVMTETHMLPGLHELRVDGDRASAYRIGENPGGEFRERVEFVRLNGSWYRTASSE